MRPGDDEHAEVRSSLGAYALDALDVEDQTEADRHLERCSTCRDELEELRSVAGHLPAAVTQLAPPSELKTRIMAEVEAEAELLRAAGSSADRVPRRRWARAGAFLMRPLGAAAAATVLLVVALGGFLIGGASHRPPVASPPRTVEAHVERSEAPNGRAALVLGSGGATLVVSKLPEPSRGRVYQVWLVGRGSRAPRATDALFTVNGRGGGHVVVPGDLRGVAKILVTVEPRGGSDVPSQLVPLISAPVS